MASSSLRRTRHIGLPMGINLMMLLAGLSFAGSANATAAGVVGRVDGQIRLYSKEPLLAGQPIQLQTVDARGRLHCCARFVAQDFEELEQDASAIDFATQQPTYRYRLRVSRGPSTVDNYGGMAVIGRSRFLRSGGTNALVFSDSTAPLRMWMCTSAEGVHVAGQGKGNKQSHLYVALGYEVEKPTCTKAELGTP